jgi:hypothetical protein
MRDHGVHARVGDIESMHVAHAELDAITNAFSVRKAARDLHEGGALLDADHAARESRSRRQCPRNDARATTEVEDDGTRSDGHLLNVGPSGPNERRISPSELQSVDEPLQGCVVLLVDELHRVPSAHHRPPLTTSTGACRGVAQARCAPSTPAERPSWRASVSARSTTSRRWNFRSYSRTRLSVGASAWRSPATISSGLRPS